MKPQRFRVAILGNRADQLERVHRQPEGVPDLGRLTVSERDEFDELMGQATDRIGACLDVRRLSPWRRFRLMQIINRATWPKSYEGRARNIAGRTDIQLAFESSASLTLGRQSPHLVYLTFPEISRPDDLGPCQAAPDELPYPEATARWRAEKTERISRLQRAWDHARSVEQGGNYCPGESSR